jgi:hypothetical protein
MKEKGSKNAQIRLIRALLCNKLDYSWLLCERVGKALLRRKSRLPTELRRL